jgi:micrococcal nuclease
MIYSASVIRVIDGDTVEVNIELIGFEMYCFRDIRLEGVYAPEIRGKEKEAGRAIAKRLREKVPVGSTVGVVASGIDSFGRIIGDILIDGESIADTVNSWMKKSS